MSASAYNNWDREAAVKRAIAHADSCGASCDGGRYIYNFAFGSNLNPAKVESRKMFPAETLRGVLPGWRLLFNHTGGFGNIEETTVCEAERYDLSRLCGSLPEVHGVLLKLTRDDFARLAWEEYAYDTIEVPVSVYGDDHTKDHCGVQHALAFKTNACALASTRTLPSARYIGLIADGAKASNIEPSYCRWLDSLRNACRP